MGNMFFPNANPPGRKRDEVRIPRSQVDLMKLQLAEARIRGEAARKVSAWTDHLAGATTLAVILLITMALGRGLGYWEVLGPVLGLAIYVAARVMLIRRRLLLDLAEIRGEVAPPTEPE